MFMIVGLGNPGKQYHANRHNFGFMAVDYLHHQFGFPAFSKKSQTVVCQQTVHEKPLILLKPLTFMNNSGNAVAEAARFYKIPVQNIYVFHDDLDIPLGSVKIKQGGGHGGHNGLRSLDHLLGKEYWRIRLGISHPGHASLVSNYVLHDFSVDEEKIVQQVFEAVQKCFSVLIGQEAIFSTMIGNLLKEKNKAREKEI